MIEVNRDTVKTNSDFRAATNALLEGFNLKRFLMEFIGTFALVYFGNWATIFNDIGQGNNVAVALTVGFITIIFTWIGGNISGAHYNPITTMSMIFLKKIGWSTGCIYWICQLLGGIVAGCMIYLQVPPDLLKTLMRNNGLGIPTADKRYTNEAVWGELVATFFFQFTYLMLTMDKRAPKDVYAIATGSMMAVGILTVGSVSGGGLNPARVFGPAIITAGLTADILIYIGGPLAGSLLAAFLYKSVFMPKKAVASGFDDNDSSDEENKDDVADETAQMATIAEEDEAKSDEDEDGSQSKQNNLTVNGQDLKNLTKDEKLRMVFTKNLGPGDDDK